MKIRTNVVLEQQSEIMNLSEEKLEFLHKVFNLLDCNGDGILDGEVIHIASDTI